MTSTSVVLSKCFFCRACVFWPRRPFLCPRHATNGTRLPLIIIFRCALRSAQPSERPPDGGRAGAAAPSLLAAQTPHGKTLRHHRNCELKQKRSKRFVTGVMTSFRSPPLQTRPFSPPKAPGASPPPAAPLARAESSSSLSSNASLGAANNPAVGKERRRHFEDGLPLWLRPAFCLSSLSSLCLESGPSSLPPFLPLFGPPPDALGLVIVQARPAAPVP